MSLAVSGLYCYPVKSCRGIAFRRAEIGRMGLRYDRQWLIVDERGMFVAQRAEGSLGVAVRSLCFVSTAMEGGHLILSAPDMPDLALPQDGQAGEAVPIQVWRSACVGIDQGLLAADWVSEFAGRERPGRYRLVRMADDGVRKPSRGDGALAYADGYPLLVIGEASLDDLNARMATSLPMLRFRPNIVLTGGAPYIEDGIARLRIGAVELVGRTRCTRCAVTTTDPLTGARGAEPLATLATYRRAEGGVVFGRNFNHEGEGVIAIGNPVEILA